MTSLNVLVTICLVYVAILFMVAFWAERAAASKSWLWIRSPFVYTLSLSVYCTGWTFFGAVGYAARSGLEYITIYLGPTLVMIGWWWGLRKLVRIGRSQRVTSIADLLSSRYGKSNLLAIAVTILCIISVTPYIALQLQSIALSLSVFVQIDDSVIQTQQSTALWAAIGLGAFTILFGTRTLDANERHHGVVMAVAVEAVVKLFALLAVGIFVVWGLSDGLTDILSRINTSKIGLWQINGGRWTSITLLAGAAIICLPRMFQMMVVENEDESHLRVAAWAFPLYLLLISLFVIPIAVVGLDYLPTGSNPDLFVLSLPLSEGQNGLAIFAFLGGFSAATSMVIVSAIALSIMVSNHLVMPVYLSWKAETAALISGDVRKLVLMSRRIAIFVILALGYFYYRLSGGGTALASIGLIAFAGIAQILPAVVGGLFWRGATKAGALAGLTIGFIIWVWTLLLPALGASGALTDEIIQNGPYGLIWLRPQALFGIVGMDSITHSVFWSLSLNSLIFIVISLVTFPTPIERLQGSQFANVFSRFIEPTSWTGSIAQSEDLMLMAQRILGSDQAQELFQREAKRQGSRDQLPQPTPGFIETLELELSGSVGTATAHAMVSQITGGSIISVEDLLAVADESAKILEYSNQLEEKSEELTVTANKLREANQKLTQLSTQKDAFLSQISHELRTPMTSIRTFSEIMRDDVFLNEVEKKRYAGIINDEAVRLTRLLDDLLDLSVLESGKVTLNSRECRLREIISQAVLTAQTGAHSEIEIFRVLENEAIIIQSDLDRLVQVFINLIVNARKYCDAMKPELLIRVHTLNNDIAIDFLDNGSGIPEAVRVAVFEKFTRVGNEKEQGAGLGLAICREIMARLGGDIRYLDGYLGGAFRVLLPKRFEL
ncbi:MAG: sensor histidine kinase [Aestuariivita sp.]|nr:sensor histidine kinase [Aestuariivita sp.]